MEKLNGIDAELIGIVEGTKLVADGKTIPGGMRYDAKLLLLCADKGWNQIELARRVGVGKSTANNWFKGLRRPNAEATLRLARIFDVPTEYLLDDTADEPDVGIDESARMILRAVQKHGLEPEDVIAAIALAARSRDDAGKLLSPLGGRKVYTPPPKPSNSGSGSQEA